MSSRPAFGPPHIELCGLDLNQHLDALGLGPVDPAIDGEY
ncbi:hypothetical protein QF037_006992 [Streptomyces canus]|jgi:hypothetical protein|nr:hypothetical protein [Streptomyces canus]